MSKFSEKFEDTLMFLAEKIDDNKYLMAIKNAFTVYMPFIITGSFATLFNALISSPKTGLAQWIPILEKLGKGFSAINFATLSFMTVPIIFLTAMQLARKDKMPEYITGVVAVAAYISVVPSVITVRVEQITGSGAGISSAALGAQGLFVGMITAVTVTEIFKKLVSIEKIKIKMPPSVPAGITTSFNTLIPILLTLCMTSLFGSIFYSLTGQYINEAVYSVIQAPMEIIFQSPSGIFALVIFSQIFWFLGIHGGLVITPVRNPLMAAAIAANIAAAAEGKIPVQAVTYGFWMNFIVPGGAGITLSLIFAIFLFSRRDDYRMIAKIGLLPGLCNISEPIVFGIPLVLNPTFAIPFIFNSGIATLIGLFATKTGFLTPNTVDVPFGVPILIGPFIGHGWQGVAVQTIILAVCTFTWGPFVLISNRKAEN